MLFTVLMFAAHPLTVVAAPQKITVDELIKVLSLPVKEARSTNHWWQQGTRNIQVRLKDDSVDLIDTEEPAVNSANTELDPLSIDLSIPFLLNQSKLTAQGHHMVNIIAKALQSDQLLSYRFLIEGHTDKSGHEGFNRRLSLQRAQAVKAELSIQGVNIDRLDVIGRAADEPMDMNNPYDADNRRVKLIRLENNYDSD